MTYKNYFLLMKVTKLKNCLLLMKCYDKLEQISTHETSWYTRTVLLIMKSNGISELFLLPKKRNDKSEQFCSS